MSFGCVGLEINEKKDLSQAEAETGTKLRNKTWINRAGTLVWISTTMVIKIKLVTIFMKGFKSDPGAEL